MMHLDEEQVERVLHGELPGAAAEAARAHLAACALCRASVAAAEREEEEVHRLLGALDHEPPAAARPRLARDAMTRAARGVRRGAGWRRRAAGLLVALGAAGVAYAFPGSPVPGWVDAVVARLGSLGDRAGEAPAPPVAPGTTPRSPTDAPESMGGIAVAPGGSLLILFTRAEESGEVEVLLTDADLVRAEAPGIAASFTADEAVLRIESAGTGARFRIEIPRTAPRVEIRVGARRIFLKEGERITAAPAAARGSYLLPLAP